VTLIGATHERDPGANAAPTSVGKRARIVVRARHAVGLRGIRAEAAGRVTRADRVTLIQRQALDRVDADAGAVLTAVETGAGISVVARHAVDLKRVRTDSGVGIAGAGHVALIER
jgi:hypothetical protein